MPGQHIIGPEDVEALMSGVAPDDARRETAVKREREVQEAMRKLLIAERDQIMAGGCVKDPAGEFLEKILVLRDPDYLPFNTEDVREVPQPRGSEIDLSDAGWVR